MPAIVLEHEQPGRERRAHREKQHRGQNAVVQHDEHRRHYGEKQQPGVQQLDAPGRGLGSQSGGWGGPFYGDPYSSALTQGSEGRAFAFRAAFIGVRNRSRTCRDIWT